MELRRKKEKMKNQKKKNKSCWDDSGRYGDGEVKKKEEEGVNGRSKRRKSDLETKRNPNSTRRERFSWRNL